MIGRSFLLTDQVAFASLSGDFNPLHIDPVAARRLVFGRPVVHGIHLLLWALETTLDHDCRLASLKVSFKAPVGVGEAVGCAVVFRDENGMRLVLEVDGRQTTVIEVTFAAAGPSVLVPDRAPPAGYCRVLTAAELATATGALELTVESAALHARFPRLAELLPSDQLAFLLATTRLVGMECPGLHSLYSSLALKFVEPALAADPRMVWRVRRFDPRTSYVDVALDGAGATGHLTAFLRPAPRSQAGFGELKSRVAKDVFAGRRALVIGGSRGLGEVCAKLLAAGGADVRLTCFRGLQEAKAVAADIAAGGGRAEVRVFDVLGKAEDLTATLGPDWAPTHLYYFATPPIFVAARKRFSSDLFAAFCGYYVTGFVNLVKALDVSAERPLRAFYPSSVAVDDPPADMGEYAAAKAAGEMAARFLAASDPNLAIRIERLPRLPTDQTASLLAVDAADPVSLLLGILAEG